MIMKQIIETGMVRLDHCLQLIALVIGTSDHVEIKYKNKDKIITVIDPHLAYLMNKLTGKDPLDLDGPNRKVYERLKGMIK